MQNQTSRSALVVGAIGVVFGDIGTSPLYALKEVFNGHHPIPVDAPHVLGILSLIFWAVMLLVSIKYVHIIMRADNRGEGGSLALLALITNRAASRRLTWLVTMLGIFAAALFFGDSMITPAISVMSAMEGLEVITPTLKPWVIPMTAIILTLLFAIQRHGTRAVGMAFGPVMIGWFGLLAVLGVQQIAGNPSVLRALNPLYALTFFSDYTEMAFLALGSVVLTVTGGEALYTDMGHFGRTPIRIAWFGFVVPALMLNYFGQGALLLAEPEAIRSPFFHLGPHWALIPLVAMATLATIIASQAVISGAFSVARQSVQMGLLPRLKIIHTSGHAEGQIFVPFTNWTLYIAVMALVVGFGSSSNLAAAYGIAVTGTMMIDTVLLACVMLLLWSWRWWAIAPVIGILLIADLAFFGANIIKIPYGGWFPIVMGIIAFTVLTTWRRGRQLVAEEIARNDVPLDFFIGAVAGEVQRVPGNAIFMTSSTSGVPAALLHNLKHNKILHERVILVTVQTADRPIVDDAERIAFSDLGNGFYRLVVSYGFMEDPDIPAALEACAAFGHRFEELETSYYLSRETIVPNLRQGLLALRAKLFSLMSRNALSATEFFRIPSNRVVELGTQLQI